ncbi:MAG TPA: toast rack family protein [Anaerolineales bacterium]|nr:toast rack family protein [Anaerolineales bacterium]
MFRKPILLAVAALVLASLACGVNIETPVTEVKTGPTETEEISVPLLESKESVADLTLEFGAGNIKLASGAEDALVAGTAEYNVEDFKPDVSINGDNITISQGDLNVRGIPQFQDDLINNWDLQLGSTPLFLRINAGAYTADYELGGLSLTGIDITDGAADVDLTFSEPNLSEMETLTYNTGASNISIEGLGNANLSELVFRSGAGSYTLDFSGEMQRDMTVSIESGISSITIIVPEGVAANLTFEGGMSNVTYDDGWEKDGSNYTLAGDGYTLTISVKMGAGNLELKTDK